MLQRHELVELGLQFSCVLSKRALTVNDDEQPIEAGLAFQLLVVFPFSSLINRSTSCFQADFLVSLDLERGTSISCA